jgi:mono/diheme cytochrome c family protein
MKRLLLPLVLSALTLAAPGTSAAADGKALYTGTCVACHGANGKGAFPGVADLGPRMAKTDAQLSNSILNGLQSKGSPMAMPVKGGNPKLTPADAAVLVTYIRTMFKPAAASKHPK